MAGYRRWMAAACVSAPLLLLAHVGAAQEQPPPAGSAGSSGSAATDVVRLKNGGLLRGTISELVPGETVTIVTVSGKTREISMAVVEYAGPADQDPSAPKRTEATPATPLPAKTRAPDAGGASEEKVRPYVTVEGKRARLHLESDPPGMTFHRQSSSAVAVGTGGAAVASGYDRLCTAPCDITVPAGTEMLALSQGQEMPRAAGPLTFPPGESRVVGSLDSRAGTRLAGWLIAGGSVALGTLLVVASIGEERDCSFDPCLETPAVNLPLMLSGTIIFSVGLPIGIVLGIRRDAAKVELAGSQRGFIAKLPNAPGLTLIGML